MSEDTYRRISLCLLLPGGSRMYSMLRMFWYGMQLFCLGAPT